LDGQKNGILVQFLLISFGSLIIVAAFFNIYKKRIVLWSLGLTIFLFLLIIFSFFTMGKTFNDWTVSIDLCQETVDHQMN